MHDHEGLVDWEPLETGNPLAKIPGVTFASDYVTEDIVELAPINMPNLPTLLCAMPISQESNQIA